jgi:hypothetical protein
MNLDQIKREVDLKEYLSSKYGLSFDSAGKGLCPFHPDKNPSFHVFAGNDGIWRAHDFHDNFTGTIIDLKARLEKLSAQEAIKELFAEFGDPERPKETRRIVAEYSYTDEAGEELFRIVRFDPKGFVADRKLDGIRRVPFNLPQVIKAESVWLVEGEKDALNISKLGLVGTTFSNGIKSWKPEFAEFFKGKRVRLCLDQDEEGRAGIAPRIQDLSGIASEVKVIELPGLDGSDGKKDVSDWIELQDAASNDDLRAQLEAIAESSPVYGKGEELLTFKKKASEIEEKPMVWLWKNSVPIAMLTLLSGNPSAGKTFIAVEIASRLSKGRSFPGSPIAMKGSSIFITVESPEAEVWKPRLVACGADLDRVIHVSGVYSKTEKFRLFNVQENLPALERDIDNDPEIKLVIIDPLISFLDETVDTNNSIQVRQAMDSLAVFAAKKKIAVIILAHLNKDERKAMIQRSAGSIQFVASAMTVWIVAEDPDERGRKLMIPVKNNLGPMIDSWAFSIESVSYESKSGARIETGRVLLKNDPVRDIDPEAIVSPFSRSDVAKLSKAAMARELLTREILEGGPKSVKEIIEKAKQLGLFYKDLWRAKNQLGIDDARTSFQSESLWIPPAYPKRGIYGDQ